MAIVNVTVPLVSYTVDRRFPHYCIIGIARKASYTNRFVSEIKSYLMLREARWIRQKRAYCLLSKHCVLNSNSFLSVSHYEHSVYEDMYICTHTNCTYFSSSPSSLCHHLAKYPVILDG